MQLKGQVCTVGAETGPGATAHRGARVIFTTLHTSRWPRERPEQPLWVTGKAGNREIHRHRMRAATEAHALLTPGCLSPCQWPLVTSPSYCSPCPIKQPSSWWDLCVLRPQRDSRNSCLPFTVTSVWCP
uniref:Uncharacterized protein n=1 Tax=Rousettus aegyptiacus TaxID=9407 RepID=A0A7J8E881_ROUAE|nr:hypothetical protein HJG63_008077 [Rousettus aegyptiacus]